MRNSFFNRFLFLGILLSILSLSFNPSAQSQTADAEITTPLPGTAIQGLVQITGTANGEDFQSYSLEFTTSTNQAPAWFLIHQQTTPIIDNILGEWDTSILTDGDYSLRLTVHNGTDTPVVIQIEDIRIRNYSPIETDTPAPTTEAVNATATDQPTETPAPTESVSSQFTPSPTNPISIANEALKNAAIIGGVFGILGTLFILIYVDYRQK